ncbi:MAG: alpha/beta hydrolase [Parvularculaceae bacterium]
MKMGLLVAALVLIVLLALQGWAVWRAEKNAPPIGKFVEVDGERLHVVDIPAQEGATGPPVILIHGASVNLRDMMLALGEPLSKNHRVLIFDRPGRGYSSRPADGWRLDVQAGLIHAAARALGAERPIIVGQSLGGAVALAYALQYQDEMAGLVLLAPVSHKWPGGVAWYNSVSGWPVAGTLLRRRVIPIYGPLAARPGVRKSFAPDIEPDGYYDRSGLTLLFRPKDFRANAEDLRHLKIQVVAMSARYGELRLPTAILTGDKDVTVSPEIHSKTLAREIPGAVLDLLPGTGHALHHSQTGRVLAAIERLSAAD